MAAKVKRMFKSNGQLDPGELMLYFSSISKKQKAKTKNSANKPVEEYA